MTAPRYWAVVPAAGHGSRFGGPTPKQYLTIGSRSVLEHTLHRLNESEVFEAIVVATSDGDEHWSDIERRLPFACIRAVGGRERSDSVLSGLDALGAHAQDDDWVLVHDAARPCLRVDDIHAMIQVLNTDAVGGILAAAVRDTMKRVDEAGRIIETVSRDRLWAALTPQMFRYRLLHTALSASVRDGITITDEAQAIEYAGHVPRVVSGSPDNIKITHPDDLRLAAQFIASQSVGGDAGGR
ncbi:MAG: 2-C-methyl-D-erythritol 4-phosphate cytidylyltransferase [Pseudomonadota bacterium]